MLLNLDFFTSFCRVSKRFKKNSDGSMHNNSSQKYTKNEKVTSYSGIPFHRQKPNDLTDESFNCTSKLNKHKSNSDAVTMNYSNSNLPQLQFKCESLPNTPSDVFYTQASVDPVMPTLSPQPPVIKDENSPHFLESSQNNISNTDAESPQRIALKGKLSEEVSLYVYIFFFFYLLLMLILIRL